MKGKNQLERRKERENFVKTHARQIREFIEYGYSTTASGPANIQWRQVAGLKYFVNVTVRQKLAYQKTTVWEDIWYTIRRDYSRVYPDQMIFEPISATDPLAEAQKKILALEDGLKGFITAIKNNFDYPKYYLPMNKAEKLLLK